ncbi:MAG: DJ-1 family glyoxalase III [Bacilli bacterium]
MKKGLFVLADGFEDTEALATRDVLLRSGMEIVTCSIKDETSVVSSFGVEVFADINCNNINFDEFDFICLPGGGNAVRRLYSSSFVKSALEHFENKYMFAICAAPAVLGKYGYLNNKKFTCYPGFEDGILGQYEQNEGVVIDGNVVTAKSMYYSIPFALGIVKLLQGSEEALNLEETLKGNN